MKVAYALLAVALLAGCAREDGAFPSLAVRPVEGGSFAEPAVTPPAPAVADPALDTRLAETGRRLDAIARGFDGDASRADRAAGAAGARTVGSEGWIAAQTALAALDDWRAQAGGIATELDDLAREREGTTGVPYPALAALRERAGNEADREQARIAVLTARLPQP